MNRDAAIDGNKRVAFQAVFVLGMNGLRLDVPEGEVVAIVLALAAGDISESEFADWIRSNVVPRR